MGKDKGGLHSLAMTIALRQSQTSSVGSTRTYIHASASIICNETHCYITPHSMCTDTIVEISITVSSAINPIPRADIILRCLELV